jgi:8-oxo-dGTP pyrophosphatase MutT (NUDIX family)
MPNIRADGIAVYVYRLAAPGRYEFLQLHRSASTGEYQHSWQTIYGGIEKSPDGVFAETALQAALRELKEEANLVPIAMWQVEYLESFYFMPHDYVLVMPVFAVEVAPGAVISLNEEHNAHRWIPEKDIPQAFMWRTQREALTHLLAELHHPTPARKFLTVPLPA